MSTWPGNEAARHRARPGKEAEAPALPVAAEQAYPAVVAAQGQEMVYHQVQPHSAGLAVVASFFIPGLGSMLNEKVSKGVWILVGYVVSVALCFLLIGFVLAPAVWIYGMVAANNDAHQWNRAHGILS
jgi:TM2 domain-containing membrane protein YozV